MCGEVRREGYLETKCDRKSGGGEFRYASAKEANWGNTKE
jgi:hypothetical protein